MAPFDPDRLARRARRAYELGRLRAALRTSAPFIAAVAVAAAHVRTWQAGSLALGAAVVLLAFGSIGGLVGRGARTGAIAGLVALAGPLAVAAFGHLCSGCDPDTPMPLCLAACMGGGVIAALWAWRRAARLLSVESAAAFATAGLVGAVGCAVAGGFGLLGLAAGMVLGGVPAILVRATR